MGIVDVLVERERRVVTCWYRAILPTTFSCLRYITSKRVSEWVTSRPVIGRRMIKTHLLSASVSAH